VNELGEFLKSRRAKVQPDELGLPAVYGRRRVAGLRREELAQAAGVSVDYYVRLEQGRGRNVSESVLDAIARALRLNNDERTHLYRLARPHRAQRPANRRVRPGLQRLLDSMTDVPAFVLGRRMDVLGWNRLAAALIADFDTLDPYWHNMPRLAMLDEATRKLYPDWERVARETATYLRLDAARYPDDPELAALVGELSIKSADFRRWWAAHDVRDKTFGEKVMVHPVVGELTIAYETLRLAGEPDQCLVTYTVEPNSPSEQALRLLASWTAPDAPAVAPERAR
jgi:transcriptional regulator with XRE-family HTH domain